ncbi:hypothetical protein [Deinococcus aquatilis]|uniref:hypothetical protein n=1 Tax=Deinococcus aquatilis TaxID=519440 RepID=UPI0012FA373E|nr:hypothetical protein [Deinococcus aquatilis]
MFAAQAGYWTTPPQADEVFRLDSAYLLGWTDALGAALSQGLDWVGHWVMFPDGQYHPGEEEDVLTSKAETLGLTDRHHILALVGMIDGKANIQVYYPGVYDDLAEKSE